MFEYVKLLNGDFSPMSAKFISHICLILFGAALLALIGYRVKGMFGLVVFMLVGAAAFLYQNGLLRF